MIKKLIYQDEKSNKFWEIKTNGKNFTTTFGKIGTAGQSQIKEFENEENCIKEAEKIINEKLKKGYEEVDKSAAAKDETNGNKEKKANQLNNWKEFLKRYYGKRCVIKNVITYEAGLYFYAFDADKEKKVCEEIFEQTVGSWSVVKELKLKPENIVMFGATLADDLDEEPDSDEVHKIFHKKGLLGLMRDMGSSCPGPLFYDRTDGSVYFFPDGTPSALSKDGEKKQTLDKLKIQIVEG
jgi:predicted DNA-binding WGR domain protein